MKRRAQMKLWRDVVDSRDVQWSAEQMESLRRSTARAARLYELQRKAQFDYDVTGLCPFCHNADWHPECWHRFAMAFESENRSEVLKK